jgi:hypothetical protein
MDAGCITALTNLKNGPANIPDVIAAGTKYVDPNFGANWDSIYWKDYIDAATKKGMDELKKQMDSGELTWERW